ncbi:MAG: anthranilate synthase component I family protein [Pirellulales bacterium]|nr:anthranilate synthase component I family protein [Pirellulales bacterium]
MTVQRHQPESRGATEQSFPGFVQELRPAPQAEDLLECFAQLPHCVFFDSALRHQRLGKYSFLAADPFAFITANADQSHAAKMDAWEKLQMALAKFASPAITDLPPFQGGAAGVLSYELGSLWERVPLPRYNEFKTPSLAIGLYDVVLAFDHLRDQAWLISQGFPETDSAARAQRAHARGREFLQLIQGRKLGAKAKRAEKPSLLSGNQLAPQFPIGQSGKLTSNFSKERYLHAVQQAIDYIFAGDIFQVNLSQRLLHPATLSGVELYARLRRTNPATFAGYFDGGSFEIISASPERFLSITGGDVEARPIKGTRGRHRAPEADLFAGSELQASEKDRAENVMIVDLLRNDLSRVCEPESVQVTQLCQLETYQYVKHLVSAIRGRLRPEFSPLDLLAASFPGGSITGAPKVRAMEIIAELEPTARESYCGSLGYIGFDGAMDTSILIRTISASHGWWQLPVGGGIVAQSDPLKEYEETWHKAQGLLHALDQFP